LQPQLDPVLRVFAVVVEVDLGLLDLSSQELFGKVRTVVRAVGVGAQDQHLAVEPLLAETERRGVTGAASAHDHHASRSHLLPPDYSFYLSPPATVSPHRSEGPACPGSRESSAPRSGSGTPRPGCCAARPSTVTGRKSLRSSSASRSSPSTRRSWSGWSPSRSRASTAPRLRILSCGPCSPRAGPP